MNFKIPTFVPLVVNIIGIVVGLTHLFIEFKKSRFGNQSVQRSKFYTFFSCLVLPILIVFFMFLLVKQLQGLKSFDLIIQHRRQLLNGILTTFVVSILAIISGTFLGVLSSIVLTRKNNKLFLKLINSIINAFVYILLAVPALVLLFITHYSGLINSVFWSSVVALSVNLAPFVTKIVTASINNITQDQIDAATVFGYNDKQIIWYFKFPSVITSSSQALLVQYYTTIKLSSLAGYIGLIETFHVSQDIIKDTQDPVSGYIILTICYFVLVAPIAACADYLESKSKWKNSTL